MSRCPTCFNLVGYCTCPVQRESAPADRRTDYERQRDAIRSGLWGSRDPTAVDFIVHALGRDPQQDGLYLCRRCGVTGDPECSYGGWHGDDETVRVEVPWMTSDRKGA